VWSPSPHSFEKGVGHSLFPRWKKHPKARGRPLQNYPQKLPQIVPQAREINFGNENRRAVRRWVVMGNCSTPISDYRFPFLSHISCLLSPNAKLHTDGPCTTLKSMFWKTICSSKVFQGEFDPLNWWFLGEIRPSFMNIHRKFPEFSPRQWLKKTPLPEKSGTRMQPIGPWE